MSVLIGLVTLTFDLLTLKLVCESHLRWGTFFPNLGTLDLWLLELFTMYTRRADGRTDGRTKATLIAPFPTGDGITILCVLTQFYSPGGDTSYVWLPHGEYTVRSSLQVIVETIATIVAAIGFSDNRAVYPLVSARVATAMALSCIISKIKRYIGRKSIFFITPTFDAPVRVTSECCHGIMFDAENPTQDRPHGRIGCALALVHGIARQKTGVYRQSVYRPNSL